MPTEKPPTYEPNMEALTQRLRGNDIMSHEEFIKLVSPKTFEGLTKADTGDKFLDMIGVPTERIDRLKEAKKVEDNLAPAYQKYVQEHLQHLTEGSTYGQAKGMFKDLPWEQGSPNPLTPPTPGNTPPQGPQAGAPTAPSGMLPPNTTMPSILSPAQGPMPQGIPGGQRLPSTPHMGMLATPEAGYPNEPTDQAAGITPPSMPAYAGTPVQQPNALPPPGLLPQSSIGQPMGQPVGNENDLLPRPYQKYVDMRQHREGLRGFNPNTGRGEGGSGLERILSHIAGIQDGSIPEQYQGQLEDLRDAALHRKTTKEGSLEAQNLTEDITKKRTLAPTVGPQAQATLKKTGVETEGIQARTETENTLRDARLRSIEASIALKSKQAELAGSQKGSELMKQKSIMFNAMKYGIAQGIFDENDERSILNYIAPDTMGFTGTPPGKFKQFLHDTFGLGTGEDTGIHVAPKGTEAPAQGKTDFSDAPPGKKQGQVLNQNGKPVATWSGKAWVPISTK